MEGGYADLHNETDSERTFTGVSNGSGSNFVSLPDGPVSVDIDDITGFFAAAVGSYPEVDPIFWTAPLGAIFHDINTTSGSRS